jgi:RimK-like ATP-grasp domain
VIVFYGYSSDAPLARAIEAAVDIGVDFIVVDQLQESYHEIVLEIGSQGLNGHLTLGGTPFPLSKATAIYARPLSPPTWGDQRALQRAQVIHEGLLDWLDIADCLVVSRPSAMHSNASKPFQAQAIAAVGLTVPETLITSDREAAQAFWNKHGEVVFKSTSGVRSIVQLLTMEIEWDRLKNLPVQFQERIDGVDVRVHVVGAVVFASEIKTGAVDYRYALSDGLEAIVDPVTLPQHVARQCVELAERLELPFAGIDLRRRPDGAFVCLEVNPMPGYSYFEQETGQPISTTLVELLGKGGH